jgi:hypothetical protein
MATVTSYRLRSSSPQPAGNFYTNRSFVIQSFGAEKTESVICEDRETLLTSDDMYGLNGAYISATYRGKEFTTLNNVRVFDAEEVLIPVFMEEEAVPGNVFLP